MSQPTRTGSFPYADLARSQGIPLEVIYCFAWSMRKHIEGKIQVRTDLTYWDVWSENYMKAASSRIVGCNSFSRERFSSRAAERSDHLILIPELETIFIRVPRTGSRSYKNAIQAKYPRAIELYHHMEADGVPHGYDRRRQLGVLRDPATRLWSLYHYLRNLPDNPKFNAGWRTRMIASVWGRTFEQWLIRNETVFTNPYSSDGSLYFHPLFAVLHSLPENRKSQYLYLRPDLGTKVFNYEDACGMAELQHQLGIEVVPTGLNSSQAPVFESTPEIRAYMLKYFTWDIWSGQHEGA